MNTPFLRADGTFGLRIDDVRGRGAPSFPSPGEVGWPRALPDRMMTEPITVVVVRGEAEVSLGRARVARKGQRREPFKVLFALDVPMDDVLWKSIRGEIDAPPAPDPIQPITALEPASTTAARVDAMRVFVERWFGITGPAPPPEGDVPLPLRALEALLGERAGEVFRQNHFGPPREDEGRLVFHVENQGCVTWATDPRGDDPPVYARVTDQWERESASLSAFLIQALVLEAVLSPPWGASHPALPVATLRRLQKKLPLLAIGDWPVSGVEFFGGAGVAGVSIRGGIGVPLAGPAEREVFLGAVDRTRFEPLEAMLRGWPEVGIG